MWRLIPLILLIGCTPVNKEFTKHRVTIQFTPMTTKALLKQCGRDARGCFEMINGICFIYAKEPKYINDNATDTLGHEALHCFRGYYHGK